MKRILAFVLLFAAACTRQGEGTGPDSFAVTLPVEPAANAQVQRIDLPVAALVALRRADRGDIRVFDGRGKPLSIALLNADAAPPQAVRLEAIPVAAAGRGGSAPSVSVRVDRAGQAVSVDAAGGDGGGDRASVLFDTRKIENAAVAIAPEGQMPLQRPVSIRVETSSDLGSWEELADQVLFRPGEGPGLLGSGRIALPGAALKDRYLRLSWDAADGAAISGATLFTATAAPPPRITVLTSGVKLTDAHTLQFAAPPGPGPAAMRVGMTGRDGVVPVSLFGRDAPEQPWTPLAMAVLRQGEASAVLEPAGGMREYRLEADKRSAGLSSAPSLALDFEAVSLLAAFNGAPPYRLVAGNAEAKPAYLAARDLSAQKGPFPAARVEASRHTPTIELSASAADTPWAPRNLALWGALLLGVAVLALAAYRLLRANQESD